MIRRSRNNPLPLPFFMTYPGYADVAQEKTLLRDLEYLQQTYLTIIDVFRNVGLSEKYLPSVKQNPENIV